MPRKVFVANEILTAADVNTNLMDQAVMTFAGTAARGSAIPSPSEGMVTYLSDVNALEVYTGAAFVPAASGATLGSGSILQVVQTVKTDLFTTTSGTYVDITGYSATITPSSASNKILVMSSFHTSQGPTGANPQHILLRDSTIVVQGDTAGVRVRITAGAHGPVGGGSYENVHFNYLDSPSTTSAVTYKWQAKTQASRSFTFNGAPSDGATLSATASTITLMEVVG
jgi:hypothetical protein